MAQSKTILTMDSREPRDVLDVIRMALGPQTCEVKLLPTADFLFQDHCGCRVGIERKTVSDFLNSLASGRLTAQLSRLVSEFHCPVLILEGNYGLSYDNRIKIGNRPTGWYHGAVQMAMLALQQAGIVVLHTPGIEGTADALKVLRQRGDKKCLRAPDWSGTQAMERGEGLVRRPIVGSDGLRENDPTELGNPKLIAAAARSAVDKDAPRITVGGGRRKVRA